MEKIWYLKRLELFSGLSEEQISSIEKNSNMIVCEKKNTFLTPEDLYDKVFVVKSGKVSLYRETEDGKKFIFGILGKNEIFGSLFSYKSDTDEYAELEKGTVLCVMDKSFFERIIEKNPSFSVKITKLFGLKIYEMEVLLQEIAFKPVISRVAYILLNLAQKFGVKDKHGIRINIKLTHEEIASMIGATRESTTKSLNELKKLGIIQVEKKKIVITDVEKLKSVRFGETDYRKDMEATLI